MPPLLTSGFPYLYVSTPGLKPWATICRLAMRRGSQIPLASLARQISICPSPPIRITHQSLIAGAINGIRQDGNWEAWIEFFLKAVQYTASDAARVLTELQRRVNHDKAIIATFGRMRNNAEKVLSMIQRHIVTRPLILAKQVGIAPSTIYRVLDKLEEHGIIRQNTPGERNRLYTYSAYQSMLVE